MRNLKKILALVLALLMSLSLMATASAATTFKDDGSINDTYRQAVEVLNGLEVLKGDDNGFRPEGNITRAEVAAIIYRITTGDVTDVRVDNFTPYGQFSDVNAGSWYAGYVTYSANAGYIKGDGAGKFNPNDNVTGYEVLAMILRTVGYDKAPNEFVGPDWQLHVGSRAQQEGILDNCADVRLGEPATRQVVAEMIFRAILLNKVDYSTATLSYTPNRERVADVLGLERVEGVVVANEYADLDSDSTLPDNRTRLDVDGDAYTLNIASGMEDLGESRYAYVRRNNTNTYDLVVAELYNTNVNQIEDNDGDEVKSVANFSDMNLSDAKYYIDFGEGSTYRASDYTIRYSVDLALDAFTSTERAGWLADAEDTNNTYKIEDDNGGRISLERVEFKNSSNQTQYVYHPVYSKTIPFGEEITELDMSFIETIFKYADKTFTDTDGSASTFELGAVYVGTQTNIDISDTYSYKNFCAEYINTDTGESVFSSVARGNRLKIVDNNNDGRADFVFQIRYTLDEVVDSVTKGDDTTWYFEDLDDNHDYDIEWVDNWTPAVGDVILYNIADGKIHIERAPSENVVVNRVSFTNSTIDTVAGDTWKQSGIKNGTEMDEDITKMDEKVEYIVYFDKYENIRAYELAQGNQYGLLTELYSKREQQGQFVTTPYVYVELMGSEDARPAEYLLLNPSNNPFINTDTQGLPSAKDYEIGYYSALQRAIAHLGLEGIPGESAAQTKIYVRNGTTVIADNNDPREGWLVEYDDADGNTVRSEEFAWNEVAGNTATDTDSINKYAYDYSWTNVAKYTKGEDGVNLYTAAEWATDKNNNYLYYSDLNKDGKYEKYTQASWIAQYRKDNAGADADDAAEAFKNGLALGLNASAKVPYGTIAIIHVYAVDYVQLAIKNVPTGTTRLSIDPNYLGYQNNVSGAYVNAVDTTDYYVVSSGTNGVVRHYVGKDNVPSLTVNDNQIRAMYAVAHNTSGDQASSDYWVADVIVIEIDAEGYTFEDVIIGYWNGSQVSRAYNQYIESLSAEESGVEVTVRPNNSWGSQWNDIADGSNRYYWAYGLSNTEKDEDGNILADLRPLGSTADPYNPNGVYAATVTHVESLRSYIDVDLDGDGESDDSITYTGTMAYIIGNNGRSLSTVRISDLTGERIIYVKNSAGKVAYIVDVSYNKGTWVTPSWLSTDLFNDIMDEQGAKWMGDYLAVLEKIDRLLDGGDDVLVNTDTVEKLNAAEALLKLAQEMYATPGVYGMTGEQAATLKTKIDSLGTKISGVEGDILKAAAVAKGVTDIATAIANRVRQLNTVANGYGFVIDYSALANDETVHFSVQGSSYSIKTLLAAWKTDNLDKVADADAVEGAVDNIVDVYAGDSMTDTTNVAKIYLEALKVANTTASSNTTNKTFHGIVSNPVKTTENGNTVYTIGVSGEGIANTDDTNYSGLDTAKPLSVMSLDLVSLISGAQLAGYNHYNITVINEALKDAGESSSIKTLSDVELNDLEECYVLLKNGCDVEITVQPVGADGSTMNLPTLVIKINNNFTGTTGNS